MKNKIWLLLSASNLILFCCSLVYCDELIFPASQIENGRYSLAVCYGVCSEKLNFDVSSRDEIKVGNSSYFSQVTNTLESSGKSSNIFAKLIFNPRGGLYYWLTVGAGDYILDIPSGSGNNELSGQEKGNALGLGVRKLLFPDTIVTPAVAVDFGINQALYNLDTFTAANSFPQAVNDNLEITEFHADAVLSKKYGIVEPYGGLKIFRKNAVLSDKSGFSNVSGSIDNAGLFFGARLSYYEHEALVIEGSFIGEASFNAGINIIF